MSYKIFNIRGASGTGKTRLVYRLLERYGSIPIMGVNNKPIAYKLGTVSPLYVIGKYTTKTGGCDTIRQMDDVENLVRHYMKLGNVLFEGLIVSHVYKRWINISREMGKGKFFWIFLDTPLEVCKRRVFNRSHRWGANTELHIIQELKTNERTRAKALADGEMVVDLHYKHSYRQLRKILGENLVL